jgi:hypothetical protein
MIIAHTDKEVSIRLLSSIHLHIRQAFQSFLTCLQASNNPQAKQLVAAVMANKKIRTSDGEKTRRHKEITKSTASDIKITRVPVVPILV